MSQTVLITGATSGIGEATAQKYADAGCRLILCGRNENKLQALQKSLTSAIGIHTLRFDVADKQAVFKAIQTLPAAFSDIDILINNAGNAHGWDTFQEASLDDWEQMMDINVKGLLYVTKAVLPVFIKKGSGHIVNIGSTAAKEVYPKGNVYCASKHAVDAINQALRIDLNGLNIRVGAVHPGLVQTHFSAVRFKGDLARAEQVYKGFSPLQASDIADIIYFVTQAPPHVNIADLVVMPTAQASSTIVSKK
ncbi:MAG: SDR family NAD(P)-dependent oxidoreductase [Bacteroidetes bacterium]|nr:SDR family NAD(P)-dependent oxidoreductase [Bacteroidota bacterium]